MKILFLGDVVGLSGCRKITNDLLDQIQKNNIDFVIINAENADDTGVGLTKEICQNFFENGVDNFDCGSEMSSHVSKWKYFLIRSTTALRKMSGLLKMPKIIV